jgi:hypothetical protein
VQSRHYNHRQYKMKKSGVLVILLLIVIFVSAQTVTVNKKGFFINDVNVSDNWSVSSFRKALGEADSTSYKPGFANRIHFYQHKGIIFWEPVENKKPSEKVQEIEFFCSRSNDPNATYKTGKLFSGSGYIDDMNISKSLTAASLKNGLKTWTSKECYFTHGYKYSNGVVAINFVFNDTETKLLFVLIDPAK